MSEQNGTQARRQAIALRMLVGCGMFGAVCGASYALLNKMGVSPPSQWMGISLLILTPILVGISVIYWRNIDEAAREAHKFAWFWGGSTTMLLGVGVALLIGDDRLVAIAGPHSPSEWFAIGMFSLMAVQLAAYSLVWSIWWLRQR
ncbi:hypothetical protein OVA11_14625 [Caulobacter sp. SL161]|uniref:hypothetical protein n=1 Tax=Caulobacter sp. SL161 TaxID=2995156 RepID=UPI002274F2FB|nr:hypothetical protein [Caulobacter sp. SL161]MCY1648251.1 hypothetical protein [Caulobacter sp. SL161]